MSYSFRVIRSVFVFALILGWALRSSLVQAQVSFTTPAAQGVSIASAPDYATDVLKNPWDFTDGVTDLAEFINFADYGPGLSNFTFSGGKFIFDIVSGNDAYFHMLSPGQCGSNALGKNGQALPIDTSKYRYLVIRMYSTTVDDLYVLWYTGCSYSDKFRRSAAIPVKVGWQTYVIDLESITYAANIGETRAWSAVGSVTGLRIDPGGVGASAANPLQRQIDWIGLFGTPPAGSTHSLTYSAMASGNDTRYSLFVDDNSSPYDGVVQWLVQDGNASAASPVTIDSNYLFPGAYTVGGFIDDDWATLTLANPWDFGTIDDASQVVGSSSSAYSNGDLTGTTNTSSNQIYLNFHDQTFSGTSYRYLCYEATLSAGGTASVYWAGNGAVGSTFFPALAGRNTYSLDMHAVAGWNNTTISAIILNLNNSGSPVNYSLHWAAARRNGCSSSDNAPTITAAPGQLLANHHPLLNIIQPDARGGIDYASTVLGSPWNMDSTADIHSVTNVNTARIYMNNNKYGRQGDYFCATSVDGNNDPYQDSLKVLADSDQRIDSSRFKNATVTFYVDHAQDVVNGSVARIIALNQERDGFFVYTNGDDTFYRGERWETITQDLTDWQLEALLHPNPPNPVWSGLWDGFRVDMHEFSTATSYCIDQVEVRADDESNSTYAITYSLSDEDSDDADVNVSFYYTTTAGATSGGTPIATNLDLTRDSRTVSFDTTGLANGTYYVYGIATDGLNEHRVAATGRLQVNHALTQDSTQPSLRLDYPTDGRTVYQTSGMVVGGAAIDNIQVALTEVLVDGGLIASFVPEDFDKTMRDANPTLVDASRAGFFETVDITGVATGAHTLVVKVTDTGGNSTQTSRSITVNAGTDPSPDSPPAAQNDTPLSFGESDLSLSMTLSKTGSLAVTVLNTDTCNGSVDVYGADKAGSLSDTSKRTMLASIAATSDTVKMIRASGLKGVKAAKAKGKSVRAKKKKKAAKANAKFTFGVFCSGTLSSTKTQNFGVIKSKKKVAKKGYLSYLATQVSVQ